MAEFVRSSLARAPLLVPDASWTRMHGRVITKFTRFSGISCQVFSPLQRNLNRLEVSSYFELESKLNTVHRGFLKPTERFVSSALDKRKYGAFSDKLKRLVTRYRNNKLLVWDAAWGYKLENVLKCLGGVACLGVSGDGKTAACGCLDGRVFVWDIDKQDKVGNPFLVLELESIIKEMHLNFDGTRIVCQSYRSGTQVLDRYMGDTISAPPEMENGAVKCVTISRNGGQVVSGSEDGIIRIGNVDSGAVLTMRDDITQLRRVSLSEDGRKLVTTSNLRIRVWDMERDELIGRPLDIECIGRNAISPDGNEVVTTVSKNAIQRMRVNTSLRPEGYSERMRCASYCAYGRRIVTGSGDGRVRLWDAESGKLIGGPFEAHRNGVKCIAVSADGNRIVSGSHDRVIVWDANSGKAVGRPFSHVEGQELDLIECVAVNHNATRVVLCSILYGVCVWDVESGAVMYVTRRTGF